MTLKGKHPSYGLVEIRKERSGDVLYVNGVLKESSSDLIYILRRFDSYWDFSDRATTHIRKAVAQQ